MGMAPSSSYVSDILEYELTRSPLSTLIAGSSHKMTNAGYMC